MSESMGEKFDEVGSVKIPVGCNTIFYAVQLEENNNVNAGCVVQ